MNVDPSLAEGAIDQVAFDDGPAAILDDAYIQASSGHPVIRQKQG